MCFTPGQTTQLAAGIENTTAGSTPVSWKVYHFKNSREIYLYPQWLVVSGCYFHPNAQSQSGEQQLSTHCRRLTGRYHSTISFQTLATRSSIVPSDWLLPKSLLRTLSDPTIPCHQNGRRDSSSQAVRMYLHWVYEV